MADQFIDIHGFKVKYDDGSETIAKAIDYLSEELDRSEAEPIFDNARKDRKNHTAHFEVPSHRSGKDRNLTLVHESDGDYYRLRKRSSGSGFLGLFR